MSYRSGGESNALFRAFLFAENGGAGAVRLRWFALVAAFFLTLIVPPVSAQSEGSPIWHTLTRVDGLGSDVVRDIREDPHGNIWFATRGGVSRFDGLWETFTRGRGLASNDTRDLVVTDDGETVVWVATAAGVSRLVRSATGEWSVDPIDRGLPATEVFDLTLARLGDGMTVWAATRQGLYFWVGAMWRPYLPTTEPLPRVVWVVAPGQDGIPWALQEAEGTGAPMLLRVSSPSEPPEIYSYPERETVPRVTSLLSVGVRQWWVGTSDGVLFFDRGVWGEPFAPPGLSPVNRLATYGSAFYAATDDGLHRFNGVWERIGQTDGLPASAVLSVLTDSQGRLWVGTTAGVGLADGAWSRFGSTNGLPSDEVTTLAADMTGTLWVGTLGGVASLNEGVWRTFTSVDGLPGNRIETIALDANGAPWVGTTRTEAGLGIPVEGGWETVRGPGTIGNTNEVLSLTFDLAGNLWVGTGTLRLFGDDVGVDSLGSIARFDGRNWQSWQMPEFYSPVALAEEPSGAVWIGTLSGGLYRFFEGVFESVALPLPVQARALLVDSRGQLWVGTSDGLYRRDGEDWREFNLADGLPGNSVRALFEDNAGQLWVGLDEGVALRQLDSGADGLWVRFTPTDGLPPDGVRAITQDANGNLWFAGRGTGGLVRQRAESFTPQTRFLSVPRGVYGNSSVFVEFSGGDARTPPDQMRYSVRRTEGGVVGSWSPPQLRSDAFLDNLPNGQTVIVEARAVDRTGAVDPTPARAEFFVDLTPPTAVILQPLVGNIARGVVSVVGRAFDESDFEGYVLTLPDGAVIASDQPITNGTLAEWDSRGVPDGAYAITLEVRDRKDGDDDTAHLSRATVSITVDNTPPTATLTLPGETLSGRVTLRISAFDANLQRYRVEYTQRANPSDADWRTISAPPPVTGTSVQPTVDWDTSNADGLTTVRLQAFDAAGNVATAMREVQLNNPSAKPTVEILLPQNGQTLSGAQTIFGTVSDATLTAYQVEARPGGATAWTLLASGQESVVEATLHVWDTTAFADGAYELRARGVDDNGYAEEVVITVRLDNVDPVVVFDLLPTTPFRGNAPIRVGATIEDENAEGYRLEYARSPGESWNVIEQGVVPASMRVEADWSPGNLNGDFRFRLTVTDRAGNAASRESAVIALDAAPPTILMTLPKQNSLVTGVVVIDGTVEDENLASYEIAYQIGTGAWQVIASVENDSPTVRILTEWDTSGINGSATLRVTARDQVGLTGTPEFLSLQVDNSPPTVVLSAPTEREQVAGLIEVRGTATDANFAFYRLEWSADPPTAARRWFPVEDDVSVGVVNGRLGRWNAPGLSGNAAIRLFAEDRVGHQSVVVTEVRIAPLLARGTGGVASSVAADARLLIPPNALPDNRSVTMNALALESIGGRKVVRAVRIEPEETTLDPIKPATLEMRLGESRERVAIMRWFESANRWEWIGGTVDSQNGWMRVPVSSFGQYALVEGFDAPTTFSDETALFVQPRAFAPRGGRVPPVATVSLELPRPTHARVTIHHDSGRLARRLVDDSLNAGRHAFLWDGRDDAGNPLPNGMYIVSFDARFATRRTTVVIWNE